MDLVLADTELEPKDHYWCPKRAEGSYAQRLPARLLRLTYPAKRTRPGVSAAAKRYAPSSDTPQRTAPVELASGRRSTHDDILPLPMRHSSTSLEVDHHVRLSEPDPSVPEKGWILLGVRGGTPLYKISQVLVTEQSTDRTVFSEIQSLYKRHRGWLRVWFSIWRLQNYNSVKVRLLYCSLSSIWNARTLY